MFLTGITSGLLRNVLLPAPSTALILVSKRTPVIRFRSLQLHFAAVAVCAVPLWVGPFAVAIGALTAGIFEIRLLLRDSSSRVAALRSAIALAPAAVAARFALATSPPLQGLNPQQRLYRAKDASRNCVVWA